MSAKKKPKKKKRLVIIIIILSALLLIGAGIFAVIHDWQSDNKNSSTDTDVEISKFAADEYYFLCGEEYTVTFTIEVKGKTDTIELCRNGSKVGVMKDDGSDGDAIAADGIYTCAVTKTADTASTTIDTYQAKVSESSSEKLKIYNITQADILKASEAIERVDADIDAFESEFDAHGTDEEKIESAKRVYNNIVAYFDELVEDGTVIKYTKEKNNIIAVFYGITYVYTFDLNEDVQNNARDEITRIVDGDTSKGASGKKKVASIQPYASELSSSVFDSAAMAVGELYGYEYIENADDSEVSVDFMQTLDQYDVIVWDGHGGYNSVLHSFVGIGEPASNAKLYPKDTIGSHPAIAVSDTRILVTSYFFEKYYDSGDFDNTVIFMAGCHTADDDYLANVFLKYGAKAYYGYKNSVYTGYNRNMTEALFESLTEMESDTLGTTTITAALAAAKEEHGASDPTINRNWWYKVKVFFGWIKDSDPAVLTLFCENEDKDYRLLIPSGTLAGKVCKASDRITPIPNATIDIYSQGKRYTSLKSDEEGYYSIELPVGSYRLEITAEGYIDFICYADVTAYNCTYTETFLLIVGEESDTGVAEGSIRHALTGKVENDVTITIYESWNNHTSSKVKASTITNSEGEYSIELPLGNYTLKASKKGFVDCYFNIIVQLGVTDNQNGTIMPSVAGNDFFITLTWGAYPEDLDSHVEGMLSNGSSFHVDYRYSENRDYQPGYEVLDPPTDNGTVVCRLDCDDINSYGPEHITLHATTDEAYYYYIHNYSGDSALSRSNAHVTIHQGNDLIADFHVPTDQGDGCYWNVFAIKDGKIIVKNTITNGSDTAYAD